MISRRAYSSRSSRSSSRYWGTDYDWRKAEAKLNALPQFITTIDGMDIHFIHVRSRHPNALPLIMTHGWPGSVFELLKTVGPLTDPTAYGGRAEDAFDLVLPSMPGFGFSGKPTEHRLGSRPHRASLGRADEAPRLHALRRAGRRLGLPRLERDGAPGAGGPAGHPHQLAGCRAAGGGGGARRRRACAGGTFRAGARSVRRAQRGRQDGGQVLHCDDDRPAAGDRLCRDGLPGRSRGVDARPSRVLALDVQQQRSRKVPGRRAGRHHPVLADQQRDLVGADLLGERRTKRHWRGRAEDRRDRAAGGHHGLSREIYRAPETWARRAYRNLIYFHEVDKGGHFAAWEQPELFAAELRAAFRSLRGAR